MRGRKGVRLLDRNCERKQETKSLKCTYTLPQLLITTYQEKVVQGTSVGPVQQHQVEMGNQSQSMQEEEFL